MSTDKLLPEWAARVPPYKIRQLYQFDAKGIYDESLIDEVGFSLLARCQSIVFANQAVSGQAPCPRCGNLVLHHAQKDEILRCGNCYWSLSWADYFGTIQNKQLYGAGPVLDLCQSFMQSFPLAQTPREKVFLIDQLIHGFHWNQKYGPTRPMAVNLIRGRLTEIMKFLDDLTYSEHSTAGIQDQREEWLKKSQTVRAWMKGK